VLPSLDPEEIRRPEEKKLGGFVEAWGHRGGRNPRRGTTRLNPRVLGRLHHLRAVGPTRVLDLAASALTSFVVLTLSGFLGPPKGVSRTIPEALKLSARTASTGEMAAIEE